MTEESEIQSFVPDKDVGDPSSNVIEFDHQMGGHSGELHNIPIFKAKKMLFQ